jgi:hypothetical protein
MKKILKIFIVIFILTAFGYKTYSYFHKSGNSNNPKHNLEVKTAINSFFTDLKNGKLQDASKYLKGDDMFYNVEFKFKNKTYEDVLKKVFSKIDYKIENATVGNSAAEANVQIISPDLLGMYNKCSKELDPLIKVYLSGNANEKEKAKNEIKGILKNKLEQSVKQGEYPKLKGTVKINLIMKAGKWVIVPNTDLIYYLTGRMIGLMSKNL